MPKEVAASEPKKEKNKSLSFIPPHATTAEQILLGILMLENESWDEMIVRLAPQDFYDSRHRCIYEAIYSLIGKNKPVDAISVIEELSLGKKLDQAGGKDYIAQLAQNAVGNSRTYSDIVYDRSMRRKLLKAAQRIIAEVQEGGSMELYDLINKAEQHIFNLSDQDNARLDVNLVSALVDRALQEINTFAKKKGQLLGISSGFSELDKMTSGLQNTDFIVVAGRPSMGKTSFALNIAAAAAAAHNPTVIFSMEMDSAKLLMRLISMLGHVPLSRLRDGNLSDRNWRDIRQAALMLETYPIYIDDSVSLSPMDIRSKLRRVVRMLAKDQKLGLVIVDYIQLMRLIETNENRVAEISEISRSLKSIAKEFNVPIVALSQLNRALEARTDRRPIMADLRESGAIEQDADLILMIYRDEVYHKDKPENKRKAEIIIAKQRNGPIGTIELTFEGTLTSFRNIERSYKDVDIDRAS